MMNINRNAFPVALEGIPFILTALAVTLACAVFSFKIPALLASATTLFIIYFFRNPERITPDDLNAIVAPADGVVVFSGDAHQNELHSEMRKISIFMSVFNVHVNRVPFSGRVVDIFYKRGKFLDARDDKATFENEQSGIVLETDSGSKIVFVQVAGLVARRIVTYPKIGDLLTRGQRYGLIRFGSRVDVYIPKKVDACVAVGDKTVAGKTIIGYLK